MKRLFWAVLAAAFWNPVFASPVSEYDLVVDSCVAIPSDPYAPPGSPCNAGTIHSLESTSLVLSSSPAAYEYIRHLGASTVSNVGFEEIVVPAPGLFFGPEQLYPVPPGLSLCIADCDLKITASMSGASLLDVMLSVNNGADSLRFSGGKGTLASDHPLFGGDFTGHFELVGTRDIPEPGTWWLVLIAGLGLVVLPPRWQRRGSSMGWRVAPSRLG